MTPIHLGTHGRSDDEEVRPPSLPLPVFQSGKSPYYASSHQSEITSCDTMVTTPHSAAHQPITTFTVRDIVSTEAVQKPYDSCASSLTERGDRDGWEGYEKDILPPKVLPKTLRDLRYIILNVYRRLFTLIVLVNIAVFIWVVFPSKDSLEALGNIVLANVSVSILIRQDRVVNGLFWLFTSIPQSAPLWLRKFVARVYSLGGIHSGSAVAATLWLIYFAIQVTQDLRTKTAGIPLVVVTYTLLLLLMLIIMMAMPTFRRFHHDSFEMVHRFLGWTATALLWAQILLLIDHSRPAHLSFGLALMYAPAFWLVLIITSSIASSWIYLRKVPVTSQVLSKHAVRLHFDYVTPTPGSFTRVSNRPLTEWHSFATIKVPDRKGYDMIISQAGDWTSKAIAEPPTHLWIRGVPTFGVMNIVPLFRRLIIVATGSGIAPCAPHIFAKKTQIKLLWTSRNIRKTFGDAFVDAIMTAAPDAAIYDTDAHGRPDMVKLVHHMYKDFDAEAVCIISNPSVTNKVVYGLMSRGVPAFGAIWDS
ncbi:hypothetical protein FRB96_000333 [Tulasnella sp. 330]|nr:hypothetical protein FRB96_000333 [Tulasnella sp. 330]KAG8871557.1 hypothetical protein FRB97_008578 [Tulasnella sp. 331]